LDDDDRFLPGKLRWVAEVFSRDPGVAYYHNSITRFSGSHEPNELSAQPREPTADTTTVYSVGRLQAEPSLVRQIWDSGAAFNASSIAVRRAMLDAHLDDLRAVRGGVGAFLLFAALSTYSGNIVLDAERWTLYRRHESNTSTASAGGPPAQWARDVSQAPAIVDDAEVILRMARRSGLLGPAHLFPVLLRQRRYSFWKAIGWPRSQRALVWASFEGYLRVARGDSRGNALVLVVLGIISLVSPAIGRTLVTPGKAPNGG
ncbi:MAG: hypothetical protein L3J96_07600, partial [Thermoplasmata archaeon]|nr:hypothetical protein [Thermoplasmata archaeon]